VDAILFASQKLAPDMVHLTDEAGWLFVDGMLRAAEDIFGAELIDLEMDQGMSMMVEGSIEREKVKLKVVGTSQNSTGKIEKSILLLNNDMTRRGEYDNLMFAQIRAELDTIRKEDRIVITGLSSTDPIPTSHVDRLKMDDRNCQFHFK
jgi:hypothetical protein